MGTRKRDGALTIAAAAVPVVVAVVLATGYDSTVEAVTRSLTEDLLIVGGTVIVLFELVLFYVVVKYRNSGEAPESLDNPRFLSSYILAVGVVLLFVGVASFQTLAVIEDTQPQAPPDDAERVHVVSEQWAWTFEYPDEGVTNRGTLVVPVNETVHMNITSRDVVHSLHVPDLGLKQDAHPAQWNHETFTPTTTGEYDLFCAEYCGVGHSTMLATIRVVDQEEYDDWIEEQGGNFSAEDDT